MEQRVLEELLVLLKGGVGLSVPSLVSVTVVVLATSAIGAYLGAKLKNVATREDIRDITRRVEEVREIFSARAAAREQQYRLQLAAIDRRLEVHQEAWARWQRLVPKAWGDEAAELVADDMEWFRNNCVYLSSDAAEAFRLAEIAAWHLKDLAAASGPTSPDTLERWKRIETCGDQIIAAVGLPPIGRAAELEPGGDVARP